LKKEEPGTEEGKQSRSKATEEGMLPKKKEPGTEEGKQSKKESDRGMKAIEEGRARNRGRKAIEE